MALIDPVFTANTTRGTANINTRCHSPLTGVGHWCGSPLGMAAVTTPPAGTDVLLSPGCHPKTPLHYSQPCDHQHLGHWQNIKRQMDGKVPGWPDHSAGDVSFRCQRDWTHIYSGLFQSFSWPWGQVLFTDTCLILGNNLKQTFNFFFFNTRYNKNVLKAENSCLTIFDIFFFLSTVSLAVPFDWVFLPLCSPQQLLFHYWGFLRNVMLPEFIFILRNWSTRAIAWKENDICEEWLWALNKIEEEQIGGQKARIPVGHLVSLRTFSI